MVKIRNLSGFPLGVQVVRPDGSPDTVHVAVRGKVTLADGFKVNANWRAINGALVKIEDTEANVVAEEVSYGDDR